MDTSETYIKMSKAAWGFFGEEAVGYLLFFEHHNQDREILLDNKGNYYACFVEGFVPLETQDQLQEMLGYKELKDREPAEWFCFGVPGYRWDDDFGYGKDDEEEIVYYRQFTSMEQLWLAFVMKEKYGKVWNVEEWVKEG